MYISVFISAQCPQLRFRFAQTISVVTMSDDFLRLVSSANPATRQYQPAMTNGYPPSASRNERSDPQLLDPFFDDDDYRDSESAFGQPQAMESQESGLPLGQVAAVPAGHSKVTLGDGVPQEWNFDDLTSSNQVPFSGSGNFPGVKTRTSKSSTVLKRRKWKWPWEKERILTGERVIALNNSAANTEFCSNFISTSKYSLVTFLPKFLFGARFGVWSPWSSLTNFQNNSRSTLTCSSYSPHAYSRYRVYLQRTGGLPLHPW